MIKRKVKRKNGRENKGLGGGEERKKGGETSDIRDKGVQTSETPFVEDE